MTAPAATGPIPGTLVHEGAFYRDAPDLLALTVPFVRDGLTRGERCWWPPRRTGWR